MRAHPFLNPIEAAIFRWLIRSPRVGFICVKEHNATVTWVLHDETDQVPLGAAKEEDISIDDEPDSMKLERIYHQPDADR